MEEGSCQRGGLGEGGGGGGVYFVFWRASTFWILADMAGGLVVEEVVAVECAW